jgi:uncharacterized membrane protein YphA (DoxX/SURF4 family)
MKIASLAARILMGLMFALFGLNGFLQFLNMGPLPGGPAGQFLGALFQTHYSQVVSAIQLGCGLLLLSGQFVPLAITLLGPVIVNILLFHILMEPKGIPLALIAAILWFAAAWPYRSLYFALLQRRPS